jgi:hypothetical protein
MSNAQTGRAFDAKVLSRPSIGRPTKSRGVDVRLDAVATVWCRRLASPSARRAPTGRADASGFVVRRAAFAIGASFRKTPHCRRPPSATSNNPNRGFFAPYA